MFQCLFFGTSKFAFIFCSNSSFNSTFGTTLSRKWQSYEISDLLNSPNHSPNQFYTVIQNDPVKNQHLDQRSFPSSQNSEMASTPVCSTRLNGSTTSPVLLDIFSPELIHHPWARICLGVVNSKPLT